MAQPYAHTAHYVGHLLSNHPSRRPSAAGASPPPAVADSAGRLSTSASSSSSSSSITTSALSREALVEQLVDLIIMEEEDAAKDLMGVELGLEVRPAWSLPSSRSRRRREGPSTVASHLGPLRRSAGFRDRAGLSPLLGLTLPLALLVGPARQAGDSALDQYILSLMHKVRGASLACSPISRARALHCGVRPFHRRHLLIPRRSSSDHPQTT
jgi:hypothetical protein